MNRPAVDRPVVFDVRGAARYVGRSEKAIRRLVEKRRIPFSKVGPYGQGRVRFLQRDLDRWLAEQSAVTDYPPA